MKSKVMFFNAQEVVETKLGYKVYRYDRETLAKIDHSTNKNIGCIGRYSCGTEIRFYTDSDVVIVTLLAEINNGNVCVYAGNYFFGKYELKAGEYKSIVLKRPPVFNGVNSDFFEGNTFSNRVWRICPHNCQITLSDIDVVSGVTRPPLKEEMPAKTMLAYGSSITHGSGAICNPYCYIENVGRLLGLNILNKGVGGSCFCEKEVADMLVTNDFDYAYLELGVNMVGSIEPDDFKNRIDYLVSKVAEKNVPVFMTTIYRYSAFYTDNEKTKDKINKFNEAIEETFNKYRKSDWKLLCGKKILSDTTYLTVDGIHPSTEGHIEMAHNIVNEIKDIINK